MYHLIKIGSSLYHQADTYISKNPHHYYCIHTAFRFFPAYHAIRFEEVFNFEYIRWMTTSICFICFLIAVAVCISLRFIFRFIFRVDKT